MRDSGTEILLGNCPQRRRQAPRQADEPVSFAPKHSVVEGVKSRQCEAAELAANKERPQELPTQNNQSNTSADHPDLTVAESLGQLPDICPRLEGSRSLFKGIKDRYTHDHLFTKVLGNIRHYKTFELVDGLLYTCNRENATVLCIPSTIHNK
jgi:hypothetical protein